LGWSVVNAPSLQLQDQKLHCILCSPYNFRVLIEIFALFFLNLYRTSLSDIKYFQNETTNVEYRILALELAILTQDIEALSVLVKSRADTERNFILSKGQTTVELERQKVEATSFKEAVAEVVKILRREK
jgi:hypothetical protein